MATDRLDHDHEEALREELPLADPELSPRPAVTREARAALWLALILLIALLIAVIVLIVR